MFRGTTAQRLVAVFLVLAVLSFGFEVAAHWHRGSYDDQQCQFCHIANSISVDLSHAVALAAPSTARTFVPAVWTDPHLELVCHQLASRAPPASSIS